MSHLPEEVLSYLSQDQVARRTILLLRCPIFSNGVTTTKIGENLERAHVYPRKTILPRLDKLRTLGIVTLSLTSVGPPMYILHGAGRRCANMLYEKLKRTEQLEKWDSDWDEVLQTGDSSAMSRRKTQIQEELLAFLYFV
jgi:hypothetical protein